MADSLDLTLDFHLKSNRIFQVDLCFNEGHENATQCILKTTAPVHPRQINQDEGFKRIISVGFDDEDGAEFSLSFNEERFDLLEMLWVLALHGFKVDPGVDRESCETMDSRVGRSIELLQGLGGTSEIDITQFAGLLF